MALKRAVEEAITLRYYLRSIGIHVTKPAIIHGDKLSAITKSIIPSSSFKKNHLALSYHFCRENFSAGVVDIQKNDGKYNYVDPFTKASVSNEFYRHINEISEN